MAGLGGSCFGCVVCEVLAGGMPRHYLETQGRDTDVGVIRGRLTSTVYHFQPAGSLFSSDQLW